VIKSIESSIVRPIFTDGAIFLDRFDDVDGTLIAAHSAEIGGNYTGNSVIVGNAIVNQSGANEDTIFDTGVANKSVSFDLPTLTNFVIHSFRRELVSSFWYVSRTQTKIKLFEVANDVFITRVNTAIAAVSGESYRLTDDGYTITVHLNGVEVVKYQSSSFNIGTEDLIRLRAAGDSVDNLEVRAL